ncbi:MAG: hypothetical protein E5W09_15855 [Mesorhizobium sp.]|nr:MAG: hypothetical protein E5W09_15855 [Mesorhizobium sp.]TKD40753.1 MAG: hypothetical protein E5W98_20295 [Mesorhizobium sp.]
MAQTSGGGIVAFDAANEDEARARLADRTIRRDLIVFQNEGRPLWNGVSEIQLREAKPKEAEIWEAGQSIRAGDDKGRHVFLVPIVDREGKIACIWQRRI